MDPRLLTTTLDADDQSLLLRFEFEEDRYPFLLSISSLLYDLELTHDLAVLLSYHDYKHYDFSANFWYRDGRPLSPYHRLRTFGIVKQSPLTIEVVVAAVGGFWVLIQALEKVANWKLSREKLGLEIEKLKKENALKDVEILERQTELQRILDERRAHAIYERLLTRLSASPIRLIQISVRRRTDDKDNRHD